jgi:hypothetical protein
LSTDAVGDGEALLDRLAREAQERLRLAVV